MSCRPYPHPASRARSGTPFLLSNPDPRKKNWKTLSDYYAELGADFGEEIERRACDAKLILDTAAKYGVPVDMLWKPTGVAAAVQIGGVKGT